MATVMVISLSWQLVIKKEKVSSSSVVHEGHGQVIYNSEETNPLCIFLEIITQTFTRDLQLVMFATPCLPLQLYSCFLNLYIMANMMQWQHISLACCCVRAREGNATHNTAHLTLPFNTRPCLQYEPETVRTSH